MRARTVVEWVTRKGKGTEDKEPTKETEKMLKGKLKGRSGPESRCQASWSGRVRHVWHLFLFDL